MSPHLKECLKDVGLFVVTLGGAAAVFFSVMYSEQKANDSDLTQLKTRCEAASIKTAENETHETTQRGEEI